MLALVVLSLVAVSQAYPTGAPIDACAEGIPNHHAQAAELDIMPFALTGGAYSPAQPMQLTLSGAGRFRGFQMKASVGTFLNAPAGTQLFRCLNNADTVTHSDNSARDSVTVTYLPPANAFGPIGIRVTVVQDFDVWWNPEVFILQRNGDVITG